MMTSKASSSLVQVFGRILALSVLMLGPDWTNRIRGGEADTNAQPEVPTVAEREAIFQAYFARMNRHLKGETGPSTVVEPSLVTENPEPLKNLGARPADLGGLDRVPAFYRQRFMYLVPELEGRHAWETYLGQLRQNLGWLLGELGQLAEVKARMRGAVQVQGLTAIKLRLDTEPAVSVPAWLFKPSTSAERMLAVVIVHPEGKKALLEKRSALVRARLARGGLVLALDPGWAGVALENVGPLYVSMNPTNVLPNVLRIGDLPQFAALVAPRALWLNGVTERFRFTRQAYTTLGHRGRLRVTDYSADEFENELPNFVVGATKFGKLE